MDGGIKYSQMYIGKQKAGSWLFLHMILLFRYPYDLFLFSNTYV